MTATPRHLAKLRSLLAGLEREVAQAGPRLRALLLAGDDTRGARASADTSARRILEIGAELASLEAQQATARKSAIAADADRITAGAMAAIDDRLAALKPPALV